MRCDGLSSGTLSHSAARLLTRVVKPANENQLVRFAEKTTTARIAARCIERDYRDRWFFKRPDGRAVPACGYRAAAMVDDDIEEFSDSLNNPPRGGSESSQAFGSVTPV